MRYIGSKAKLLEDIELVIKENIHEEIDTFADIFAGTGSVSNYFKDKYRIISNDILYFSHVLQQGRIENNTVPNFTSLKSIGILDPIKYLETKDFTIEENYFITHNFSPYKDCNRMYLTIENACRVDFIRLEIEKWKDMSLLTKNEYSYLIMLLIESVPFVSNISGTYGAYLKHWDTRALNPIKLKRIDLVDNKRRNKCHNEDSNVLIKRIEGDVLYIDPPYNGRQYGSNYHLLETIARYDYPEVKGVTGLRPYEDTHSKYCLKNKVLSEFKELIKGANFRHIIMSYSSDGLMSEDEIITILKEYGIEDSFKTYKLQYLKYKSKHKQKPKELVEYLFYIQKDIVKKKHKKKKRKIEHSTGLGSIKSPLNYIGGKYKLLEQITPLFPSQINNFVDLFAGGLNVGINVSANRLYANDINNYVISILKTFSEKDTEDILQHIHNRIEEFGLSKTNEAGFKDFREYYNKSKNPLDLYTLICYSFNYQFRFNNNHEYNNPFGRNRSQFSNDLKKKLIAFIENLKEKDIAFTVNEFDKFDFTFLSENDFVYCDPPYLITTGSYNDGNRGFKDWNEEQELKLFSLLDELNQKGIRFALSNVLTHKGMNNDLLREWSSNYNVHHLDYSYSNSSHNTTKGKSEEILITNY